MITPIRVVVADDSAFIRGIITSYLEAAGGFEIVGTAIDGDEAVDIVRKVRPDVVTMDVDMPRVSGLEALEMIMCETPTPIVMVSGVSRRSAEITLQAVQSGAVDFVLKFVPGAKVDPNVLRLDIVSKVRSAAGVRVVRTLRRQTSDNKNNETSISTLNGQHPAAESRKARIDSFANFGSVRSVVVIGASTGGPVAIKRLLANLPDDFESSVVIVQHLPEPFTEVLAAQLSSQLPFIATVANDGETLKPRHVYVAPGGKHLLMSSSLRFETQEGPPISGHCPSIDVTMKSVAQHFPHDLYGVLLTGMGEDGASGMAFIKSRGGRTFVQSDETCVVNGMPQQAIRLGAADHISSPEGIAERLALEVRRLRSIRQTQADNSTACIMSR